MLFMKCILKFLYFKHIKQFQFNNNKMPTFTFISDFYAKTPIGTLITKYPKVKILSHFITRQILTPLTLNATNMGKL